MLSMKGGGRGEGPAGPKSCAVSHVFGRGQNQTYITGLWAPSREIILIRLFLKLNVLPLDYFSSFLGEKNASLLIIRAHGRMRGGERLTHPNTGKPTKLLTTPPSSLFKWVLLQMERTVVLKNNTLFTPRLWWDILPARCRRRPASHGGWRHERARPLPESLALHSPFSRRGENTC